MSFSPFSKLHFIILNIAMIKSYHIPHVSRVTAAVKLIGTVK